MEIYAFLVVTFPVLLVSITVSLLMVLFEVFRPHARPVPGRPWNMRSAFSVAFGGWPWGLEWFCVVALHCRRHALD